MEKLSSDDSCRRIYNLAFDEVHNMEGKAGVGSEKITPHKEDCGCKGSAHHLPALWKLSSKRGGSFQPCLPTHERTAPALHHKWMSALLPVAGTGIKKRMPSVPQAGSHGGRSLGCPPFQLRRRKKTRCRYRLHRMLHLQRLRDKIRLLLFCLICDTMLLKTLISFL